MSPIDEAWDWANATFLKKRVYTKPWNMTCIFRYRPRLQVSTEPDEFNAVFTLYWIRIHGHDIKFSALENFLFRTYRYYHLTKLNENYKYERLLQAGRSDKRLNLLS